MRLLLLSNGHGEDAIGAALAPALQARGFTLDALPIVGEGHSYRKLGLPIVGPTQAMPSGGFVYGRPAALAGDMQHGLIGLTRAQIAAVRHGRWDGVVAIGDVVVLGFAWLSRAPFVFVGCAKSDYYTLGRPGSHLWHERLLMRHPRCAGVFARDAVTAANLLKAGVDAYDLGNPMMDGLEPRGLSLPGSGHPIIALVPGSRPDEAVRNFQLLASLVEGRVLAAIAPDLPLEAFQAPGVHVIPGGFADVAHACDVAVAMAGTATEQLVGLGKPVISVAGAGPQFTAAFAEAQTRLLGPSIRCLPADAATVMAEIRSLLADKPRLELIAANGRERMGAPGASQRIADGIAARWLPSGSAATKRLHII
ncbi:MAG: hypothetical protein JWM80_3231 [Cyanobacteria bacterium RYN_339]|nr:hypothetical protein [Cyanobacteria bacterium RYN_339]